MKRRDFIYLGLSTFGTTKILSQLYTKPSLKSQARAKGLIYGSSVQASYLLEDKEFAHKFVSECAILTPENELKWHRVHPNPDRFNFKDADFLVEFTQKNNLLMRGHTLIWHDSTPRWIKEIVDRKKGESVLINHIETVVGRYKGLIHSWDVVNEAIYLTDGNKGGLRHSHWLYLLGKDYIDLAFRVASEADPQALLVYNDHDLVYDIPPHQEKQKKVLKLLEWLKAKGTPIHALGIQAHLISNNAYFNAKKFRQFLADVASLGLKIMITEMDVSDMGLAFFYGTRDQVVADIYSSFLGVALDEPNVIAVITWGLSDRYTWLSEFRPRKDGTYIRPLPLDANLKPKLAWHSIIKAFDNATQR